MDPGQRVIVVADYQGFPAHAGMDPFVDFVRRSWACAGFPAHAGMDPSNTGRASPHTGPQVEPRLGGVERASPHTRGWTLDQPLQVRVEGWRMDPSAEQRVARPGFPAHAGMDPGHRRGHRRRESGFPAHAGMDPVRLTECATLGMGGFPAHAGMDP